MLYIVGNLDLLCEDVEYNYPEFSGYVVNGAWRLKYNFCTCVYQCVTLGYEGSHVVTEGITPQFEVVVVPRSFSRSEYNEAMHWARTEGVASASIEEAILQDNINAELYRRGRPRLYADFDDDIAF